MILEFGFFILGLTLLFLGGDFLIRSIRDLSYRFQIKPLFFSLVLLGMGTSAPEWFVTVFSSAEDFSDLALGNVVGSNISNIGLILGLFGLFQTSSFSSSLIKFDFPVLLISFLLTFLFSIGGVIHRWEGGLLLLVFLVYLILVLRRRKQKVDSLPAPSHKSPLAAILFVVFGFSFLFLGSYLTIHSVVELGNQIGLSERLIGLFILSVGTSLPELSVCLQALFKKEEEMALGNIVGSNLFNTLFVLGSAGLLAPLNVSSSFLHFDYWVMLAFALVIWLGLFIFKSVPQLLSAGVLLAYISYVLFLFL